MASTPILRRLVRALACALAPCLLGTTAFANDMHLGASPGAMLKWRSDSVIGGVRSERVLADKLGDRLRVGAELAVRDYHVATVAMDDVRVSRYSGRAVVQVVAFPHTVTPYAGFGVGFELLDIAGEAAQAALRNAGVEVQESAVGARGAAFLGLQVPVLPELSLFAEGRAGLAFELNREFENALAPDDIGSVSGFAGMRLAF